MPETRGLIWFRRAALAATVLCVIVVVVGAVTYLGLLRFRHWAPIAAVFLTVAGFAFIPLAEPIEQHAVVTMLVEFGTMLWGAVLACVYWSPIRRRFGLT